MIEIDPVTNRVHRSRRDHVGNDLSAQLMWCSTHEEPAWVYDDGSFECPHDLMVGVQGDGHLICNPPWGWVEPTVTIALTRTELRNLSETPDVGGSELEKIEAALARLDGEK